MQVLYSHIINALEILRGANLKPSTIEGIVRGLRIGERDKQTLLILINGFPNYFPNGMIIDYSKGMLPVELREFTIVENRYN